MKIFSCFSDLCESQCAVSDLSVFNAELYLGTGNEPVDMNKLRSILNTAPRLSTKAKFLLAFLDFCRDNGKELGACENLRQLNPGKKCFGIDDLVDSTLLLPTNTGLGKKYFAVFKRLRIDVGSVKNREKIRKMNAIIGFRPTAHYSDEATRKQLQQQQIEQQQKQQIQQLQQQKQQQAQQNKPPQQGRLF